MYDFKRPLRHTHHFCIVQSSPTAGKAANITEHCFVVCKNFCHRGFVFSKVFPCWEPSQYFRVKQNPQGVLQLFGMLHHEHRIKGAHAPDSPPHTSEGLSINFSVMVAVEEKHSVFICFKLCWFSSLLHDAPSVAFLCKRSNFIALLCQCGLTSRFRIGFHSKRSSSFH